MKTAAIKMVSCARTYSARKKASCISEATAPITIFVQVSQHVSVLTHMQQNCQVGVQGREMPNGSGTGDKEKPQRTQYSVTQKVKKAKAQLLANTMASRTLVIGVSLLVARRPCKKEPGVWQLPLTSARFSNWSN